MTIVHESSATTVISSPSTDYTATAPSGIAAGDVLIASLHYGNNSAVTAPSGWVLVGETAYNSSNAKISVWRKVAGGSEPGSYAFSIGTAATGNVGISRFSDVDNANPLDGTPAVNFVDSASDPAVLSSITTSFANSMLVGCVGVGSGSTSIDAWDSPLVEQWEVTSVRRHGLGCGIQAAAGASGAKNVDLSAARTWGTVHFALRESVPAAGNPWHAYAQQ